MPAKPRLNLEDPGPELDAWEGVTDKVKDELHQRGEAKPEDEELRSTSFRDWALQVPEARSGTLDLDRFAYQREWYDDHGAHDREQVDMKANQVGDSTKAIRHAMYHADRGAVAIYCFPTLDMVKKFSRQRIKPVIRSSEYLKTRIRAEHIDTVDQKQIGWGWLYFFGTEEAVEATDADLLTVDEYDFCNQANIDATERRVTGPFSAGIIRRLGIPTVPGFGISALYEKTDQRAWTVSCKCGEWNRLVGYEAFKENVDQEALELVCRKCRRPLDVRAGEWVSAYPDRDIRGYHIPKLIIPGLRLGPIVVNSRKTKPHEREAFFRRDLGVGYAPEEGMLSVEAIRSCQRTELRLFEGMPPSDKLRTMSIDVASKRALNVIIREAIDVETSRMVFCALVEDEPGGRTAFEQCCFLMQAFHIQMAAIDNAPDGRFSMAFCERFPGRAYRVAYFEPKPGQRKDPPDWNVDDDERFVSVNRTKAIDATFDLFRTQRNLIPPLDHVPEDYMAQLRSLVAQTEDTPSGNKRRFFVRTGEDDWAHTEVYNLTAIELFWRASGISQVRGQGPTPLADQMDFTRSQVSDYEREPEYRPGPADDFGPDEVGLGGEGDSIDSLE